MFGDLFSWYMTSMGEFWGSSLRIGLPQILLVILVICWLRRKRCGKACGKKCCWIWSCGSCDEEEQSACCDWAGDCGCTCGLCCCQQGGGMDEDDEDHDDEDHEDE